MVNDMLEFHFENFTGPMDLLNYLIEKDRIDIYDIPIADLTDQYIDYLNQAKSMNLEIASHFLLFATRLISIKVRLLLPRRVREAEPVDPRQELVDRILIYRFYKEAALILEEQAVREEGHRTRDVDAEALQKKYGKNTPITGLSLEKLFQIADAVLHRTPEAPSILEIENATISLEWMMQRILDACQEQTDGVSFRTLLGMSGSRDDVIALFLALLECVHLDQVEIVQPQPFEDIFIYSTAS